LLRWLLEDANRFSLERTGEVTPYPTAWPEVSFLNYAHEIIILCSHRHAGRLEIMGTMSAVQVRLGAAGLLSGLFDLRSFSDNPTADLSRRRACVGGRRPRRSERLTRRDALLGRLQRRLLLAQPLVNIEIVAVGEPASLKLINLCKGT